MGTEEERMTRTLGESGDEILHEGSKTKIKVGSEFPEFYVMVDVHQGSALSPLLLAIVVGVVTENAREA